MKVHILHEGQTLCGFGYGLVPKDWPDGHRWASVDEPEFVTCKDCLAWLEQKSSLSDVTNKFMKIAPAEQDEIPQHEPDYENEKGFYVEYFEYECGMFGCTPDGCPGHKTDIPIAIEVDGVRFEVEGSMGGDFPGADEKLNKQVIKVVKMLENLYETNKDDEPSRIG